MKQITAQSAKEAFKEFLERVELEEFKEALTDEGMKRYKRISKVGKDFGKSDEIIKPIKTIESRKNEIWYYHQTGTRHKFFVALDGEPYAVDWRPIDEVRANSANISNFTIYHKLARKTRKMVKKLSAEYLNRLARNYPIFTEDNDKESLQEMVSLSKKRLKPHPTEPEKGSWEQYLIYNKVRRIGRNYVAPESIQIISDFFATEESKQSEKMKEFLEDQGLWLLKDIIQFYPEFLSANPSWSVVCDVCHSGIYGVFVNRYYAQKYQHKHQLFLSYILSVKQILEIYDYAANLSTDLLTELINESVENREEV